MHTLLILLLLLLVIGGLPAWGYHSLGWGPSGVGIIVFVILLVILLRGGL